VVCRAGQWYSDVSVYMVRREIVGIVGGGLLCQCPAQKDREWWQAWHESGRKWQEREAKRNVAAQARCSAVVYARDAAAAGGRRYARNW